MSRHSSSGTSGFCPSTLGSEDRLRLLRILQDPTSLKRAWTSSEPTASFGTSRSKGLPTERSSTSSSSPTTASPAWHRVPANHRLLIPKQPRYCRH
ncbi:hypothetical protein FFLO_05897 [Filobasidium floriforme]|uniref:Uncharacterized protein n=1 Tax=Filobasidium floriforme TaxID=5210 RepID=A0A8K0JGH4_9TREE|nr:hypothetical protein FFLO_05897 [Filobasidium floriforme]